MGAQLLIRKELKRDGQHIMLSRDRTAGKDIEEIEKNCDTLDVMEDLFCDEEIVWSLWVANY